MGLFYLTGRSGTGVPFILLYVWRDLFANRDPKEYTTDPVVVNMYKTVE